MAKDIITTDNDSHAYYAPGGGLSCGNLTCLNPTATQADLLSWVCGEISVLKELSHTFSDMSPDSGAHIPIAVLQMVYHRLTSTMPILELCADSAAAKS